MRTLNFVGERAQRLQLNVGLKQAHSSIEAMSLEIFCADIGSIARDRFGWTRKISGESDKTGLSGTSIIDLVDAVAEDLNAGRKVALGFECPLFVPLPRNPHLLTAVRPGEGSRPWCAGAGSGALATGLTETA